MSKLNTYLDPAFLKFLNVTLLIYVLITVFSLQPVAQETVTDFDGIRYKTVLIGDQLWMAENLRSTHDANGKKIKRICYQLISENCEEFGGMYAWDDLNIDENNDDLQGICPEGWHIPSDTEWSIFIDAIGGADSAAYKMDHDSSLHFNIQYGGNYHKRLKNYN